MDEKDEKQRQELQELLVLVHGVAPPEHKPGPYAPPGDASNDSNGQVPVSSMPTSGSRISEFSSSRPSMPVFETSTTSGAVKISASLTDRDANKTPTIAVKPEGLSELNQILYRTSEVLYGRQLSHAPQTVPEALQVLNKLRVSIGLPKTASSDLPAVLAAAKESASTVGC